MATSLSRRVKDVEGRVVSFGKRAKDVEGSLVSFGKRAKDKYKGGCERGEEGESLVESGEMLKFKALILGIKIYKID